MISNQTNKVNATARYKTALLHSFAAAAATAIYALQRWARYFIKVPAVPVLGTLLKVLAVPVLGT